ncbi:MAG: type II secretion system F family protein [Fuerstiella sp.]
MFWNPRISAKVLFPFCRSIGRMLESGVDVRKAVQTSSAHTSDPRLTVVTADVVKRVKQGDDLTTSFAAHAQRFPRLFLDLLNVGEQTGSLPEIFSALADYYEAHVNRMREFRAQIAWPLFQLFAAILIIGFLIYILGIIGQPTAGAEAEDILGLGLVGTSGSIKWFTLTFGTMAMTWIGYTVLTRNLAGQIAIHPFLMVIPGVGYCMRSFAIARFSWCFALTQQAGMSIKPSLEASINATGNGAFIAALPGIWRKLADGETLTDSLQSSRLFPVEYLHIVETAEQTGTVPEALDRLSHRFDEDAHRAMTWMTSILARLIWGLVACFIGYIVISFFMRYVAMINSLSQ